MRAQLLHLSGPSRGRTVTYAVPRVTIGSDPTSTAFLRDARVASAHARIDWKEERCAFHLHALDGQVFVNGNEVKEVILQDEDEIEFGVDGPRARFRVYVPTGAVCKPVRRMFADAEAVRRVSGSGAATGALTRDLLTQATLTLKVGFPIAVALAALAGWFGGWLSGRPTEEERQRTADMVTQAELKELSKLQEQQREAIARLSRENATVRRIQQEWSRGVCLIHGVFRLRLSDKSWFTLDNANPFEVEYTGSGFLATDQGHILTNRHVVVPWDERVELKPLIASGAMAEFVRLTATFPGRAPIEIPHQTITARADSHDVAVVQVPVDGVKDVPVLPIATVDRSDHQRAVVVGYPTGLAALLARADSSIVETLQQQQASMAQAIDVLAAAGSINPVITQGGVNVEERVITYDAETTFGGSGGPVFGGDGEVIAVNFGIQPHFTGLNYGVPIRFARDLLPR